MISRFSVGDSHVAIHCRDECSQLKADLEEKIKALELLVSENKEIRAQLEEINIKAKNAEAENKMLIDRWMLEKMKDAEQLNEVSELLLHVLTTGILCCLIKCYSLVTPRAQYPVCTRGCIYKIDSFLLLEYSLDSFFSFSLNNPKS